VLGPGDNVEQAVVDAVRELLADVHGSASLDDGIAEAERELSRIVRP
jgi:hypothetical protein